MPENTLAAPITPENRKNKVPAFLSWLKTTAESAKKNAAWPEGNEADAECSIRGRNPSSTNGLALCQSSLISSVMTRRERIAAPASSQSILRLRFKANHPSIPKNTRYGRYCAENTMTRFMQKASQGYPTGRLW